MGWHLQTELAPSDVVAIFRRSWHLQTELASSDGVGSDVCSPVISTFVADCWSNNSLLSF